MTASTGEKAGTFGPGKTVKITTESVEVRSQDVQVRKRVGKLETELKGYALTITDKDGKVLAEKFSSTAIKAFVTK